MKVHDETNFEKERIDEEKRLAKENHISEQRRSEYDALIAEKEQFFKL